MQGIILAAGEGKRIQPLTFTRPKPLLKIVGRSILEYNLDALNGLVKEVIIVIGYKGEMIKNLLGKRYKKLKIRYVIQNKQQGTGDALKIAQPLIKDRFVVLNGDDIYSKRDIKNCLKNFPCILLQRVSCPESFGQVVVSANCVKNIVEKPKKQISNLVNTGLYFLDKSIFAFKIKRSERGEYELIDFLKELVKERKLYFNITNNWMPISYSWNLLDVNQFLMKNIKTVIKGRVEKNCHLTGKVLVERGSVIKSGAYIEGPVYIGRNCIIGPNCYIRPYSAIHSFCRVGHGVEVKNSIIYSNSRISHLSYIGDSIIGENCNLGAGTILANLRFDQKTVRVSIGEKIIDTRRQKFGAVLGDNVKTGVHSSLMPGVLIGPKRVTKPSSVVFKNLLED